MAFDKTPAQSTYVTKDIKLLQQWETRDSSGTKDNDTINCFFEVIKNKTSEDKDYYVTSRDGTEVYASVAGEPRGIYHWEEQNRLYVADAGIVHVYTADTRAFVAALSVFSTTTGDVGFTEFNYPTGEIKLVATDGSKVVTIDSSNVVTPSVSLDLPTPHLPYPVFLDGFLFLVKAGTADIYNSNLDNPLLYTAGDFLSAEMLPDNLRRIARLNNYVVAFGTSSIEYFFNAANATASPLQRNDTPIKLVGYLNGFATWGNSIIFVGQTTEGTPEVYMLDDFKIDKLGTPPGRRYLASNGSALIYGSIVSMQGHDFYVINQGIRTYMMDLSTKLWTRLIYRTSGNFPIKQTVSFSIVGLGFVSVATRLGTGTLLEFTPSNYLDAGVDFNPTIVTDNEMFDSYREKFGCRLSIIADRPTNSSFVTISWSDDDFQTFSAGRTIALNQRYPQINATGKFRRRAHKIVHTGNARFRVQKLEFDINIGNR